MKKIILIISVILAAAVCIAGALWLFRGLSEKTGAAGGILPDRETNEKTAYSLQILKYDEIESEYIRGWVDKYRDAGIGQDGKAVYYTLSNDDYTAPLDMYLFMPEAKTYMGDITVSNVKVNESGAAVVLNIDAKDNISRKKDGADMILRLYVSGSPEDGKARSAKLIINGETYTCPSAAFTKFK